jgi:hypothetical protein
VATFGTFYAIRTAPEKTYREQKNKADAWNYQLLGFFTSLAGFLVWNIDNMFVYSPHSYTYRFLPSHSWAFFFFLHLKIL